MLKISRFSEELTLIEAVDSAGQGVNIELSNLPYDWPTPAPTPVPSTAERLHSPNGQYGVSCEDGVSIYRTDNGEEVVRAELDMAATDFGGCEIDVDWAKDSSALALVTLSGDVYVVRLDGSPPKLVGSAYPKSYYPGEGPVDWAPDSKHLMVVQSYDTGTHEAEIMLIDPQGNPLQDAPYKVQLCYDCGFPHWFTNDVLEVSPPYHRIYYVANTGWHLFSWNVGKAEGVNYYYQPAQLSPNERWYVLDRFIETAPPSDTIGYVTHLIVDFDTGDSHDFAYSGYVEYLHWSDNSRSLYLVSRPKSPEDVHGDVPFGLLAYYPETKTTEVLFDYAMQVEFSPDGRWAFVVFPEREEGGERSLAAGVWQVGSTSEFEREPIADEIFYREPAEAAFLGEPSLIHAVWSNDGTRVIFGNTYGQLILIDRNGDSTVLADDFVKNWNRWIRDTEIYWTPDDDYILVFYGRDEWIIRAPPYPLR